MASENLAQEVRVCPICGTESLTGPTDCPKCGLARGLWADLSLSSSDPGKTPTGRSVELSVARPVVGRQKTVLSQAPETPQVGTGISAVAKVLKNVVEVEVGDEKWLALPLSPWKEGILRALSNLFSTHYEVYRNGGEVPISTVYYNPLEDQISIAAGEATWVTEAERFGPARVTYDGTEYTIYETVTGRFTIVGTDQPVIQGRAKFRSVSIDTCPEEMTVFLANLAIGILIRTLFSELGV